MRQSWIARTFGWIADDFSRLGAQLKKRDTWIFIGMAGVAAVLLYYSFHFALQMDFTRRLRNLAASGCRDVDNAATALLFFGTFFFALTVAMVFGEFARHLDYKRRNARDEARHAAGLCAGWGLAAVVTSLALMIFLQSQCVSF